MIDRLLGIIAPHYCYGCGIVGAPLCDSCEYDIASEPYLACIVCRKPAVRGICLAHGGNITQAWAVSEREGALERLINAYKFERVRSASMALVRLLDETVPDLLPGTIVASIPTVRSHVRIRGYDHAELLAKQLAKRRKLPYRRLLIRQTNDVQRGANRALRKKQAAAAFASRPAKAPASVLLVDDVVTTGFTLLYAAETLRASGVKTVYAAVVAKQPLDQKEKI
jgi:ComF family protein